MKTENAAGQTVDLNEDLTKADLVGLVKHWRERALDSAEILRRVEKAVLQTMAVAIDYDREMLINMAMACGEGCSRKEAEGIFEPDPEVEHTRRDGTKRMVKQQREPLPIMSEKFLYAVFGKDTARSLLYPLQDVAHQLEHASWYREQYDRRVSDIEHVIRALDKHGERSLAVSMRYFLEFWKTSPAKD